MGSKPTLRVAVGLRLEDLSPLKSTLKVRCVDAAELRELLPHPLNAVTLLESCEESLYCYFEFCCSHALVSMVLRDRAR